MSTIELVYGLGIAGAALALLRNIFIALKLKVDVKALNAQLTKLIAAGNLDRALKLCRAVPNAFYTKGVLPALEVLQKEGAKRQDLIQAFEQGIATQKSLLMLGRAIGVVAGLIAGAGLVLGVINAETVPSSAYAAPAAGLFLAVGGEFMAKRIADEAHVGFSKLLETIRDTKR